MSVMVKVGKKGSVFENLAPLLVLISIGLAFGLGVFWQKSSNLEAGDSVKGAVVAQPTDGAAAAAPSAPTQGKLPEEQASNLVPVSKDEHIRGSSDAKVLLIEYSDYECPFCARFHETAQRVVDEYAGQVAWVYRHFPLDQIHQNARSGAEASECVAELGGNDAFWAFSDAIYKDTTRLTDLSSLAVSTGVSAGAFQDCVDGGKHANTVEEQYQSGVAIGVRGTPGNLVVNDKEEVWLVPGALPFEQLKVTIDEALAS